MGAEVFIDDYEEPSYSSNALEPLEKFLGNTYEFRYDTIKGMIQYRMKKPKAQWVWLTDRDINTIWRYAIHSDVKGASANRIMQLLGSDFCPQFDPILTYFNSLPVNFGGDPITVLAETVQVKEPKLFKKYFKMWLVAVVAQAINRKLLPSAINHEALIFTGGQGKGKTTWLNSLNPKPLEDYFYSGKIDLNSKDSIIKLSDTMLINIDDQLDILGRKNAGELKGLLTMPSIKVRKPYGRVEVQLPRIASCMGSVNMPEFLFDTTGSRRFLCFEVTDIDYNSPKNIDLVWAQSLSLLKDGFKYYFTSNEVAEIEELNTSYKIESAEEIYLQKYFSKCEYDDKDNLEWSATEIYNWLVEANPRAGFARSSAFLGTILKNLNYTQQRNSLKRFYNIKHTADGDYMQRAIDERNR